MQESYTIPMILLAFGVLMALLAIAYVIKQAFSRGAGEIGGWELRGARQRITAVARITLLEGIRFRVVLGFAAAITLNVAAFSFLYSLYPRDSASADVARPIITGLFAVTNLALVLLMLGRGGFVAGFAAMILVAIPLFWFGAEGDGTVKGRVQMFVTYSLGFTGFFLALMTIFFSCRSLSAEIADRQIYAVGAKPIPRWQILAGKWCGVMFLNVAILSGACLVVYAGVYDIGRQFRWDLAHQLETKGGLTPEQAATAVDSLHEVRGAGREGIESPVVYTMAQALGKSQREIGDMLLRLPESTRVDLRRYDELRRQVLIARAALRPEIPDLTAEIDRRYKALEENKDLPAGWSTAKIREQIRINIIAELSSVPYQDWRVWGLKGPRPEKGGEFIMSLRVKPRVLGGLEDETFPGLVLERDLLLCRWGIGDPAETDFFELVDTFPTTTYSEHDIPMAAVKDDGTITLAYHNIDPRAKDVVFELGTNAIQVLYRVGSFELNLVQTWLAMLIPLACLTSFGVLASTFLSFPVGALIVVTIFILSSTIGFVAESLAVTEEYTGPNPTLYDEMRGVIVDTIGWIVNMGDCNPTRELQDGRAIGWGTVWANAWQFLVIKSGLAMAAAVLVLRRRELASVVV